MRGRCHHCAGRLWWDAREREARCLLCNRSATPPPPRLPLVRFVLPGEGPARDNVCRQDGCDLLTSAVWCLNHARQAARRTRVSREQQKQEAGE